jgi:hypothetical protein
MSSPYTIRRRKKYKDPLIPVQIIVLIAVIAGFVTGVATNDFDVIRKSGWGLIVLVILVVISRIMRGNWENNHR